MNINRPKPIQPMPADAKLTYSGEIFSVYQWQQQMYDGSFQTFEKLKRPDTVIVIPILDSGEILLTKQEQPGRAPFIGAAGGRVDKGEEALDAATRELLEETGYQAEQITLWHSEQPTSKIDWAVYIFIAKGLSKIKNQSLDAGEKIEPFAVSFEEFTNIALTPEFSEKEVTKLIYEAKLDPEKFNSLESLFSAQATS